MLGFVALWNMATGMDTASSVSTLTLANSIVITKDFGLYLSHSYLFLLHNLSFLCHYGNSNTVHVSVKDKIQCNTLTSKHEFILTDFYT